MTIEGYNLGKINQYPVRRQINNYFCINKSTGKAMKFTLKTIASVFSFSIFLFSCADKDLYKSSKDGYETEPPIAGQSYTPYLYSYSSEGSNNTVEIIIVANEGSKTLKDIESSIPPLKYNKSWLFMLTQDDCSHAAYCRTWAAINGRPVSSSDALMVPGSPSSKVLFYSSEQLQGNDLPPNIYYLNKTLGSTDGCGNEVRFYPTTTLAPEWNSMHAKVSVNKGSAANYYRFYMKPTLTWNDVKEMLNYGTGIAFHDVNTTSVQNIDSILYHYRMAQDSIVKNLSGRGAKMLAEPNGNKIYVTAANSFPDIQTLTAQAGTVDLYPFETANDLQKVLLNRYFPGNPANIIFDIQTCLKLPKEQRKAIHAAVHGTDKYWIDFLLWLNNTYGKDGDDSVWFPSQEEYYEYNYYRIHSSISTTVSGDTLRIRLSMPSGRYFYYPSLTLNLSGIQKENIRSISTNDAVTGFSVGNYSGGLTLNIDCRKHLVEHATHYVEVYEKNPTSLTLADARYFVNQLKESTAKEALLKRMK